MSVFAAVPRAEREPTTKSCRHGGGRPETNKVWGTRMNKWKAQHQGGLGHLDQNVLGQLRRGSPGLDSGSLQLPLFCRRTMPRSAPTPLFGANLAFENRDQRRNPKTRPFQPL